MDPEDGYLYDFAHKKISFGKYRLYNYITVYRLDPLYLYKLCKKEFYNHKCDLLEFLEYMEYKGKETEENDESDDLTVSIDDDSDDDDD